jgi:RNA polymerase sigma-70 factor, ECF subfamily
VAAQQTLIEEVLRTQGPSILGALVRRYKRFDLCDDALQDAIAAALEQWPQEGVPNNPAAWLATVAKRKLIDRLRQKDQSRADDDRGHDEAEPEVEASPTEDPLRLLFTCCHPALQPAAQCALALRTMCGLTTREIARAFIEDERTTAQRIVRAKRKIAEAGICFELPEKEKLEERLTVVLTVLSLLYTEGYVSTGGSALGSSHTSHHALRLARQLVEWLPRRGEALGLLAQMCFTEARRAARVDAQGALVPLEAQDRTRWDQALLAEGRAAIAQVVALKTRGPFQIQGAIAALHANAQSPTQTDWPQIAGLYGALLRFMPTPMVELNAAVALSFAAGLEKGLSWVNSLEQRALLTEHHLLYATKADLLRRLGRSAEAAEAYRRALSLVVNEAEKRFLYQRLEETESMAAG